MKKLILILVLATVFLNNTSAQQSSKTVISTKDIMVNKTKYTVRKSNTGNTFVQPATFKIKYADIQNQRFRTGMNVIYNY